MQQSFYVTRTSLAHVKGNVKLITILQILFTCMLNYTFCLGLEDRTSDMQVAHVIGRAIDVNKFLTDTLTNS